jgi:hypothetical protein
VQVARHCREESSLISFRCVSKASLSSVKSPLAHGSDCGLVQEWIYLTPPDSESGETGSPVVRNLFPAHCSLNHLGCYGTLFWYMNVRTSQVSRRVQRASKNSFDICQRDYAGIQGPNLGGFSGISCLRSTSFLGSGAEFSRELNQNRSWLRCTASFN